MKLDADPAVNALRRSCSRCGDRYPRFYFSSCGQCWDCFDPPRQRLDEPRGDGKPVRKERAECAIFTEFEQHYEAFRRTLSDRQSDVFTKLYGEQKTQSAIAEALGISQARVGQIIDSIRKRLKLACLRELPYPYDRRDDPL